MISGTIWLGVVSTGITSVVLTSRPQATFQASYVINLESAFFCLSISLNILCTVLIAGRLLLHQRSIEQLGFTRSRTYTSIVVVIVESAALYSIFRIIYIPLMVLRTSVQFPFSSLVGTLTRSAHIIPRAHLISPNLIILRMVLDSTAHPETDKVATLLFKPEFWETDAIPAAAAHAMENGPPQRPNGTLITPDLDACESHVSTEIVIDIDGGPSSGRLVEDREKVLAAA